MRVPRIYTPLPLRAGGRLVLEGDPAHHLSRVLRLRPGAPLILFNGQGGEYSATLVECGRREVQVDLGEFNGVERESPLSVTLVQAVSRGERMDYTIQKAVELGATRIIPVFASRSVVTLDDERLARRHEHWQKVVTGACEQCGRNRLPELIEAMPLTEWLRQAPEGLGLVLDHRGDSALAEGTETEHVTLLVGPEGGLAEPELELAVAMGYRRLRLGPRVLRTETAALVAITFLQSRWGDFA